MLFFPLLVLIALLVLPARSWHGKLLFKDGWKVKNFVSTHQAAISKTGMSTVDWTQARFSISLSPSRDPLDLHRPITKAITNGIGPLLDGVQLGVGVLQVLNGTSSLSLGSTPREESDSVSIVLSLRSGQAVLGPEQELWLSTGEGKGQSIPHSRGSQRFDFCLTWSGSDQLVDEACTPAAILASTTTSHRGDACDSGKNLGPASGHIVGELRPLNEFSALRQEALDKALEEVGVDPRELTEANEFFGTAALKSYNTFVRPRPKQLAKVMEEPLGRAAERTAHQVAFLVRRHRADRSQYLRNKDAALSEAERRGLPSHPIVLVCDNVRSADTARVAEVITCGYTPHPGGHGEDKLRKTAFGSIDAVPHRHFQDPAGAVQALRAEGRSVWALETTEGAQSLFDISFPLPPLGPRGGDHPELGQGGSCTGEEARTVGRAAGWGREGDAGGVALVLGNEVTGVEERVLNLCDAVVEVPVYGLKNSLNVASAGTVVLYEVLRQWSVAGHLVGEGGGAGG